MNEPGIYIYTAFGLLLGIIATIWILRLLKSRRHRHRSVRAKLAEEKAQDLLERKGYEIIESQKRMPLVFFVDGQRTETVVIADYIVKKRRRIYVAEVKDRDLEGKLLDPGIRRQLLEYNAAFKPDGVLLVDMKNGRVHLVGFGEEKRKVLRFRLFIITALLSIMVLLALKIL